MDTSLSSARRIFAKVGQEKGCKAQPKPDILKLEGDWRELMKQSLQKNKPKDGWPS